jgi:hypothetical protein
VVPVVVLVQGLRLEEVGRCRCCGGGAFALPRYRGGVIGSVCNGPFSDVKVMSGNVALDRGCCQLEMQVCDVAIWVGFSDESIGNLSREFGLPDQWWKHSA